MDALSYDVWYDVACQVPPTCNGQCFVAWLYANSVTHDAITPAINCTLPRIGRRAPLSQQRLAPTTLGLDNAPFFVVSGKGNLATCKWICFQLALPRGDAELMFALAAQEGNLDVCRWVADFYQLTTNNLRSSFNWVSNKRPMCRKVGAKRIHFDHSYWEPCPQALLWAAEEGHLDLCKWMVEDRFWFSFEELCCVERILKCKWVQFPKLIQVLHWLQDHTKSRKQYTLQTLQRWAAL